MPGILPPLSACFKLGLEREGLKMLLPPPLLFRSCEGLWARLGVDDGDVIQLFVDGTLFVVLPGEL